MRILIIAVLSLLMLPAAAQDNLSDDGWTTGLFCESVSPDKRLNNFFIINAEKSRMLVASFNEDKVSLPALRSLLAKHRMSW